MQDSPQWPFRLKMHKDLLHHCSKYCLDWTTSHVDPDVKSREGSNKSQQFNRVSWQTSQHSEIQQTTTSNLSSGCIPHHLYSIPWWALLLRSTSWMLAMSYALQSSAQTQAQSTNRRIHSSSLIHTYVLSSLTTLSTLQCLFRSIQVRTVV